MKWIKVSLAIAISLIQFKSYAQTDAQLWTGIGVEAKVARKTSAAIDYSHVFSVTDSFSKVFNQAGISVDYKLTKKINLEGGLSVLSPINSKGSRTRVYVRVAHSQKIGAIRWTNALRLEHNSSAETRFRQRVILSTRIASRNRLTSLKLLPFASYSLFYNIGGSPINYYDENNVVVARQTPDGFHRGRLSLGVNAKITQYARVTLSYIGQREFNLFTPEYRQINVKDPVRDRVLRPFNNFNALSLKLEFDLSDIISKQD